MHYSNLKAVFIVSGHGGGSYGRYDPGAVANGTTERKEILEITSELKELLYRQKALNQVEIIPIGYAHNITLTEKINEVNRICKSKNLDHTNSILISVHVNAGGGTGIEAWYYGKDKNSLNLAANVASEITKITGLKYRGAKSEYINKWGQLGIIHNTKPLAILVECGFIDTIQDVKILLDPEKDDGFAKGIAKGLMSFIVATYTEERQIETSAIYTDVSKTDWFYEAVKLCKEEGVINGYQDKTFRPSNNVNRAELAIICERMLKKFEDYKKITEARLRDAGVIK